MKSKFIRTIAAIGAAVSCAECVPMPSAMQEVSAKQVTTAVQNTQIKKVIKAGNTDKYGFYEDVLNQINFSEDKNTMFSPYSLNMALALAVAGMNQKSGNGKRTRNSEIRGLPEKPYRYHSYPESESGRKNQ